MTKEIEKRKKAFEYYQQGEYVIKAERGSMLFFDERREIVSRYLNDEVKTLLEIGCGTGIMQDLHPGYIGLDISYQALKKIKGKGVQCTIERMPIKTNSVQMIIF